VVGEKVTAKISEKLPEKIVPAGPIGIFDSGVGGLTVLKEIFRQLPHEDVIYLADTARVPYGGRPPQEIIRINNEIVTYLINCGVKLIIMACGTSSAIAYPAIKDKYKVRMVGLIKAGAACAAAATRAGTIGLIATVATIDSQAYQSALRSLKKEIKIFSQACPLFVPLVEGGFSEAPEAKKVAKEYLRPLLKEKIDTLLLGCTHYPHLRKILSQLAGPGVTLVDPAQETVAETKKMLKQAGTLKDKNYLPRYEYLVTGAATPFQDLASRLLGKLVTPVKQVKLV
jgi:glutamate racemase